METPEQNIMPGSLDRLDIHGWSEEQLMELLDPHPEDEELICGVTKHIFDDLQFQDNQAFYKACYYYQVDPDALLRTGEQNRKLAERLHKTRALLHDALDKLEELSSTETVPVVHGEWSVVPCVGYQCTECAKIFDNEYNYCPNCGADMREEKEAESNG